MDDYTKANLAWWNEAALVHAQGDAYRIKEFKAGRTKLKYLERQEVGDVSGKSLLHLQCHFGMDSLSWSRLGAKVTGIDFSEQAINIARSLNTELGLDATFVQSNIYDLPNTLAGEFDIVFTSYGIIGWLPDLMPWGKLIAHYLKPGGFFYIAEGHPFMWTFDDKSSDFKLKYSYFLHEPIRDEEEGSYAEKDAQFKNKVTYGWNHTFSEIFTSLISAGLRIDFLHEFPFCAWEAFPDMADTVAGEDQFCHMQDPHKDNMIPMTFTLKATKPL